MNRKQKIAVAIGVALVVLAGLFPPFEGERNREGDNYRIHAGHHFLFVPPSQNDVSVAMGRPDGYGLAFSSRILLSQLYVEFSIIIVATAGATLLLAKGTRDNTDKG